MTAAEKLAIKRMLSTKSLVDFCALTTPRFSPHDWQYNLCEVLETLVDNDGKTTGERLRVHAPPRVGKSIIISKRFPIWLLIKNPLLKICIITYNTEQVKTFAASIKDSLDFVQQIFPEFTLEGNSDRGYVTKERKALADGDASIIFSTVQKGYTGKGADLVIIDDPYSTEQQAESPAEARKIQMLFDSGIMTRVTDKTSIILLYHAWSVQDIGAHIVQHYNFKPIRFPSICDGGDDDPTFIGNGGWRKEGEIISPLLTLKHLEELKVKAPTTFYAMHQGTPIQKGKLVFGGHEFDVVDHINEHVVWCCGWDCATSLKKTADKTAAVDVGIGASGNIYLRNAFEDRISLPDLREYFIERADSDRSVIQVIEKKSVGLALHQTLLADARSHGMHIIAQDITGDKTQRAAALASRPEQIKIVASKDNSHIVLKKQLETWTGNPRQPDDLIDATTLAYNYLSFFLKINPDRVSAQHNKQLDELEKMMNKLRV